MTIRSHVPVDPDAGIPDLIRRLTDDSKRLAGDEIRLAKLELGENVHTAGRGTLRLAIAFGIGVVAAVAATIFLAAALGRMIGYNYWLGAMITGVIELGAAFFLFKRGVGSFGRERFTYAESRAEVKQTAAWVKAQRKD